MADDISKKITIDVEMDTEKVTEHITSLNKSIDGLLAKQQQLNITGQQNSAAFEKITASLDALEKKLQEATSQLSGNKDAIAALGESAKTAGNSLASLTNEHQKNTNAANANANTAKNLSGQHNSLATSAKTTGNALSSLAASHHTASSATSSGTSQTKKLSTQINSLGRAIKQQNTSAASGQSALAAYGTSAKTSTTNTKELAHSLHTTNGALSKQPGVVNTSKSAFSAHKKVMDHLKTSFNEIKNVSGQFGPSLKDAADGFNTMKKGLELVKGGLNGIGEAIKADGFGILLTILQKIFDAFINSSTGSKMLQGAISAVGVIVNDVKSFIENFKKAILDAFSHPVETLKSLGRMIEENLINRFKAVGVILDGIMHFDFKKIADGVLQSVTGVTHATDKIANGYTKLKKEAVETFNQVSDAYNEGSKAATNAVVVHKGAAKGIAKALHQVKGAAKELAAVAGKNNEDTVETSGKLLQAQNELADLQIKGMKDGAAKQLAELKLEHQEKQQQMEQLEQENLERIKKLAKAIEDAKGADSKADTSKLQIQLTNEQSLREVNSQKRILLEQQTAASVKKINDDARANLLKDEQEKIDAIENPKEKLAAQKKQITEKYQYEIQQAQDNAAAIIQIETNLKNALENLDNDYQAKQKALAKAHQKQVKDEATKDAKQLADQALALVTSSIKQQADAKVAALEKDKAAELSNSSLTSTQKLAIEQKYKKQEGQIKAKAFKEEQEASIAQALINGALAVTKVSSQSGVLAPLEIGITVAETAMQVAKIAAQKPPAYAKGGLHYSSDGRGGLLPGYSKTDNTNAYLRSGEGVVVSEAMQVPWARNLVSAINVGFGGRDFSITNPTRGYAVGGIFTDGGDANRYYTQPVTDQKNLANTIAYQMINNFPPVYVDVKDVNNQQNILAQTINRVNL